jgi:hypothetical protein
LKGRRFAAAWSGLRTGSEKLEQQLFKSTVTITVTGLNVIIGWAWGPRRWLTPL